jgi:hypothetical protein
MESNVNTAGVKPSSCSREVNDSEPVSGLYFVHHSMVAESPLQLLLLVVRTSFVRTTRHFRMHVYI